VDTSVILARFAPGDPLRHVAKKFFDYKVERIISPVSLLEMSAVLSRGKTRFDVPEFLARETESRRVVALSEYFIEFLGLRIESLALTSRMQVGGSTLSLPLEYSEGLKKAGGLKLRALDLLHVAYAELISNLRTRIDRFVTSDGGILDRSRLIEDQFSFRVVHPSTAAR
jgi:predicted nucleic acid-binding protein